MEPKRIDLTDYSRPSVEIKVGDKVFVIKRVVNSVIALWQIHWQEIGFFQTKLAELEKLEDAAKTEEQKEDFFEKAPALEKEIDKVVERRDKRIADILFFLMEKNGYDYDQAWWDDNTDLADRLNFISECIQKDNTGTSKKKARGK